MVRSKASLQAQRTKNSFSHEKQILPPGFAKSTNYIKEKTGDGHDPL